MSQELDLIKKGQFYFIYDGSGQNLIVEDKTKRGLPVIENSIDDNIRVMTEKGRFYDANGRGHVVPIRWYFSKENFTLEQVCKFADSLDSRYRAKWKIPVQTTSRQTILFQQFW